MPHLRLVKQANRLRQLLQVRPNTRPYTFYPGGFSHDVVLKADPKRGLPERNVGLIGVDPDGQVHMSAIDPALQGSGLAEVAYKRLAQQLPGGRLYGDNLQSPGSFGLWHSMVRKAQEAALAGKPAGQRIEGAPLSSAYRSEYGSFMSAPPGQPNWGIQMPAASVTNPAPYRGSYPSPTNWPVPAATDAAFIATGRPFFGGAVRSWQNYPDSIRTALGQPQFPPSARGSFSDVDRLATNVVRSVNQSGSTGVSPKDAVARRLTESFAAKGVSPEQGVQRLLEILNRNQERTTAAVNAKLSKGGKPVAQETPRLDILEPVFGQGERPIGFAVKPPGSTSGAAAQASTPPPRQTATLRRLAAQAASRLAPSQPVTQLALPPSSSPSGFASVTGTSGGFPPFSGRLPPAANPQEGAEAALRAARGDQALAAQMLGKGPATPPPQAAAATPDVGRVVEDWFSRAKELPNAASNAVRGLKNAWFAAGKNM